MVQSPSWEANWFAASQDIPRISRNPKVHYCTHKRPPNVPILCQSNPVQIPTSHLLEIRPNIIHPSTPRSPQCSLSLLFPQYQLKDHKIESEHKKKNLLSIYKSGNMFRLTEPSSGQFTNHTEGRRAHCGIPDVYKSYYNKRHNYRNSANL